MMKAPHDDAAPKNRGWVGVAGLSLALALGLFGPASVSPAHAELIIKNVKNTCSLARNNDVAEVIGKVIKPAEQTSPPPDAENPAVATACSFEGLSGQLTIIVMNFPSPDVADSALSKTLASIKEESSYNNDEPVIAQEGGLGETTYWVTSKVRNFTEDSNEASIIEKGTYIVRSSNRMITVGTDWSDAAPDALKPALFKLTQVVLERL